ncbi:Plasma membrane proteolipid 31 [Erysiphe necator]|uniref:Putative stress response rci peptide n=1 Tax=Uncinula necator TaxID=52586 RepID=A0A0B1PA33_UNCNE|nr:Plasma membrane proteolipid 31 [Erysiphe necator]KHJ33529.1 putative stress response rci peptide [Erysiphe necator]
MNDSDIFLGLIAILFPPFPVWVKRGLCSADSLINICLCALGGIPGILHAWYIISKYSHHDQGRLSDTESARITRYIVIHDPQSPNKVSNSSAQPFTGYGATASTNQSHHGTANQSSAFPQNVSGPVEGNENISGLPSYQEAIETSFKVQSNN